MAVWKGNNKNYIIELLNEQPRPMELWCNRVYSLILLRKVQKGLINNITQWELSGITLELNEIKKLIEQVGVMEENNPRVEEYIKKCAIDKYSNKNIFDYDIPKETSLMLIDNFIPLKYSLRSYNKVYLKPVWELIDNPKKVRGVKLGRDLRGRCIVKEHGKMTEYEKLFFDIFLFGMYNYYYERINYIHKLVLGNWEMLSEVVYSVAPKKIERQLGNTWIKMMTNSLNQEYLGGHSLPLLLDLIITSTIKYSKNKGVEKYINSEDFSRENNRITTADMFICTQYYNDLKRGMEVDTLRNNLFLKEGIRKAKKSSLVEVLAIN